MEIRDALKTAGYVIAALAIGAAVGRYTVPTKVVTKIEEKIVEKEVIKTKENTVRETNKNRELVVTETVLPDGTRKIEKHYINRDEIRDTAERTNLTTTSRDTELHSSTVTTSENANWNISALATPSHTKDDILSGSLSYGLHVQRRVLGPFSVGAFGLTNKTYGVSIGGSF